MVTTTEHILRIEFYIPTSANFSKSDELLAPFVKRALQNLAQLPLSRAEIEPIYFDIGEALPAKPTSTDVLEVVAIGPNAVAPALRTD